MTSLDSTGNLLLTISKFYPNDTYQNCLLIEVSSDAMDLLSCYVPTVDEESIMRDPYFLYYYDDYFYTFVKRGSTNDVRDSPLLNVIDDLRLTLQLTVDKIPPRRGPI